MMRQFAIFAHSEGDKWLERNRDKLGKVDPVCDALDTLDIKPRRVLEVGCANGWRLKKMRERYGCATVGIEPSEQGASEDPDIIRGAAACMPLDITAPKFDCIIFGFCLYVIDPDSLFHVAAEADDFLGDQGFLIIHDFAPPMRPYAVKYEHCEGVLSYHMDYAAVWLAHPAYLRVASFAADDGAVVTVLRKRTDTAFGTLS